MMIMDAEIFRESNRASGDRNLEGFLTLDEAKYDERIPQEVYNCLSDIYKNVVQIIVPEKNDVNRGTGFLFHAPGGPKIMTNYHVVEYHDDSKGPIIVKFYYDKPGWKMMWNKLCHWLYLPYSWTWPVCECNVNTEILYFSNGGVISETNHDFAVFGINNIPQELSGILLELSEARLNSIFNPSISKLNFESRPPTAIIIGHPLGGPKRISVVDLHPCDNDQLIQRCYSSQGTRPGNSGSPVIMNCNKHTISPKWVVMLHFASGFGVSILPILDLIRQQLNKSSSCKKIGQAQAQNATPAQFDQINQNFQEPIYSPFSAQRLVGMDPEIYIEGEQIEGDLTTFKTLDDAENDMSEQFFDDTKVIFRNVVQIISGTKLGTGLVFIGPNGNKQIMTYYDIVRIKHAHRPAVKFSYDGPNDLGNERSVQLEDIDFYSKDGRFLGDDLNEDLRFFAVLSVDEMPQEIDGISLDPATGRLNDIFGPEHWNDSPELVSKGVVVGHPLGEHKRISFVSLHDVCYNGNSLFRCYSSKETLRGSCGSPIVIRSETSYNLILHFGPGYGCHILNLIQAIHQRNVVQ